eukprot:2033757-Prymnesium_polylepis.1
MRTLIERRIASVAFSDQSDFLAELERMERTWNIKMNTDYADALRKWKASGSPAAEEPEYVPLAENKVSEFSFAEETEAQGFDKGDKLEKEKQTALKLPPKIEKLDKALKDGVKKVTKADIKANRSVLNRLSKKDQEAFKENFKESSKAYWVNSNPEAVRKAAITEVKKVYVKADHTYERRKGASIVQYTPKDAGSWLEDQYKIRIPNLGVTVIMWKLFSKGVVVNGPYFLVNVENNLDQSMVKQESAIMGGIYPIVASANGFLYERYDLGYAMQNHEDYDTWMLTMGLAIKAGIETMLEAVGVKVTEKTIVDDDSSSSDDDDDDDSDDSDDSDDDDEPISVAKGKQKGKKGKKDKKDKAPPADAKAETRAQKTRKDAMEVDEGKGGTSLRDGMRKR